jgi:threonine dehydratase
MRAISDRLRPPSRLELQRACQVVAAHLRPTPMLRSGRAWLKLETAQPTGAFKVRGSLVALDSLPAGVAAITASAGNHGLGMAWAATELGRAVTVVVPETASPAKLAALAARERAAPGLVRVVRFGTSYDEAEAEARRRADGGLVYVSAYSDWAVIAGAATLGVEICHQLAAEGVERPTPTVVVPLGGGGLASGTVLWASEQVGARVVAAGAAVSPAAAVSARAGRVVEVPVAETLADGLAGNLEPGAPSPAILSAALDAGRLELVEVSEAALRGAIRWLFTSHGLVAEGAAAAAVAGWHATNRDNDTDGDTDGDTDTARDDGTVGDGTAQPTVVAVTGRNIAAACFAEVLTGP